MEQSNRKKCSECGGTIEYDYGRGISSCRRCGLVLDDMMIDNGPDWRNFGDGVNRAHAGPASNIMIADKGLSTEISVTSKDANGRTIPSAMQSQMRRLRKWQKRSIISEGAKRSLNAAIGDINRICTILNLPDTVRQGVVNDYRALVKKAGLRGRSVKLTDAALVYAVCRKYNVSRTLDEICAATGIKRRDIGRAYRGISRTMRYRLMPANPSEYVSRFCSKLDLPLEIATKADSMLTGRQDSFIGKSPVSVAAAAVYLAAHDGSFRRTQTQVADIAGVTEVTIRKLCRELGSMTA